MHPVQVSIEKKAIPTYESSPYEELPMFAFNRNHQGTSGNPYPNRIVNKVRRDKKSNVLYTALRLENDYLDITILPELGGRIFEAVDKSNGGDFFYRQHVIKPALIGMFGLWISGGLEFNWPMHHRPGTFLPTDYYVDKHESGAVTVWLSEHDPIDRMKGMVGITLYPERAVLETRARVFNRTALPHSFLWWENAAIPANEDLQIFFPPDVTYVSHHYKRATGGYPVMNSFYMGLDNRKGVDIRFHKNARLGTSYFSGISKYDFFGAYDHGKGTGVLHHASHYISPGKKMFSWGYTNLAKDWERALTDTDGPYLELMASGYSDNQPDFSWIEPWETKEFVQSWYPYKDLGEVRAANDRAAFACRNEGGNLCLGIYATENILHGVVEVSSPGKAPVRKSMSLQAMNPVWETFPGTDEKDLTIKLLNGGGETVLAYTAEKSDPFVPDPLPFYPAPEDLNDAEDCMMTGVHVDQYHDPLVDPSVYWKRGLELNPLNPGCLTSMGRYCIGRLRFEEAESWLRKAAESLTRYNPNPRDTEAFYLLGLALARQGKNDEALEILHKSMWSAGSAIPAACAAASILTAKGLYGEALKEMSGLIDKFGKNQRALEITITLLRKTGNQKAAIDMARELLSEDPLDLHALNELRLLGDDPSVADRVRFRLNETGIDLAADYASMGLWEDTLDTLEWALKKGEPSSMLFYSAGYAASAMGNSAAEAYFTQASKTPDSLRFPSLAFEAEALEAAIKNKGKDSRAYLELGMVNYGIRRDTRKAVDLWRKALALDGNSWQAMRNLAVGLYSENDKNGEVFELLERAAAARPGDLQLYYELNLAAELQNVPLEKRLKLWEKQEADAGKWDDLFLQGVRLRSQMGQWDQAIAMMKNHHYTPVEGGEVTIAAEYYSARQALAYAAMEGGRYEEALDHFNQIFQSPYGIWNDIILCPYKYGQALCLSKMGREKEAGEALSWIVNLPIESRMLLPSFPYYLGLALIKLGREEEGKKHLRELKVAVEKELTVKESGFFTFTFSHNSFIRKGSDQRKIQYNTLLAMALSGLGEMEKAKIAIDAVLSLDPLNQQIGLLLKNTVPI
jgi:tetratricopeptide (TPR) repeat protein